MDGFYAGPTVLGAIAPPCSELTLHRAGRYRSTVLGTDASTCFYEAACQVPALFRESEHFSGHTSSERARPLNQLRGCARERVDARPSSDSSSSSLLRCR